MTNAAASTGVLVRNTDADDEPPQPHATASRQATIVVRKRIETVLDRQFVI
jgi:hypothetical protein